MLSGDGGGENNKGETEDDAGTEGDKADRKGDGGILKDTGEADGTGRTGGEEEEGEGEMLGLPVPGALASNSSSLLHMTSK